MEFFDLINHRYSVRAYKSEPVEDAVLQQVLAAARLAPTAANRQPFDLIVVHTAGREEEIKRVYGRDWFVQAPLVICVCALADRAWVRQDSRAFCDVDVAIAADHLILAAANLGLGTCWIANFDVGAAREILGVPDEVEPLIFTPLGYPADEWRPKKRRALDTMTHFERW